ncbi:DHA2 family efflux MFS transporter permease subunit [Sphingobium sp. DEHP117]|uniref:DHA2 family efflux MFS transporter permease subunit n=1 Tax=Sphingobium sp. DEHP117 TaxID=2993436 RepID=UPI0027D64A28|nr:DHA2 family efflux MFS transporter permease subunit [Sphingobium sp. DEHP117]MDQ4421185.1 DHA2 family efflux MFS transporter permease subunit [Sphingobium sp. DEHP117]
MSATEIPAAAASAKPDAALPIPRHPGWLKAAAMLATLVQVLDMTIANVALPHMQSALGANQDNLSWVLTSYIVASAIALPATGWLADHIGRRRLYLASLTGFIIASVLCGLAANLQSMVIFRVLQGLAGAFLSPLGQTVMLDSTPPEKRGQAMVLYGMGVVIGPIIGPVMGGWLTENLDWRWVFFVNVPLGLTALLGLLLFLPDVKRPSRSLDVMGLAMLAIGLASLQLMLDRGQHVDWFNSLEIWAELGLAISALWMFAVHSLTSRNPLYPVEMMRDSNLLVGSVLMFILGFVLTSAMALLPVMLQALMSYPVMDAGWLLATRGGGVLLAMAITGRVLARVNLRLWLATALAIVSLSFWDMTGWTLEISWGAMALNGFIQGLGLGMMFVPISVISFATLSPEYRTDASGILNLCRSVGASAGISLVMALLARNSATSHEDFASHLTEYSLWADPRLFAAPVDAVQVALAALNAEVTRQATMVAFLDDFYLMMLVAIAAMPFVLLIKPPSNASSSQEPILID